jgi:hypothetical protein
MAAVILKFSVLGIVVMLPVYDAVDKGDNRGRE